MVAAMQLSACGRARPYFPDLSTANKNRRILPWWWRPWTNAPPRRTTQSIKMTTTRLELE